LQAPRVMTLTGLAMLAFAGNSLLCRLALKQTSLYASSFTTLRLVSGALVLWLIVRVRHGQAMSGGSWWSAMALFGYAAGFSFAYIHLPAATGALLLFGAVQATMIGYGLARGERFRRPQLLGLLLALGGLVGLLLPGLSAPPLLGSAGNFMRAAPLAVLMSVLLWGQTTLDTAGMVYAIASGALASGLGYTVWYTVLPALKATHAATVQLSVPVLATLGGVLFLGESITLRLVLASAAILGGIALVILEKH
jgi:drug/metabolite transporter (DMT)-like permease